MNKCSYVDDSIDERENQEENKKSRGNFRKKRKLPGGHGAARMTQDGKRECTGHGAARKDYAAKKDRARERTASLDMRAISSSVWGIPLSSHFFMIPIRP